jgi:hypothetical protein
MNLLPILAFALSAQTEPMRKVDIKPAGLTLEIPKVWKLNPKDSNLAISARVPVKDSKVVGKLDIGYVIDETTDAAGFLAAQKDILTRSGSTVERQWTVDALGAPFVFTKSKKDNETTVRGVFFRKTKSKLVLLMSSPSDVFESIEPQLTRVLSTMKETAVKESAKPTVPTERKIEISEQFPGNIVATPVSHPVTISGSSYILRLPKGCVATKLGDGSATVTVPGLSQAVIVDCYTQKITPLTKSFAEKPAATAKLFKGAVTRIDRLVPVRKDMQQRQYVWRYGFAVAGGDLMTCDVLIAQLNPQYMFASYVQRNKALFKSEEKIFTTFINSIRLDEKK